MSLLSALSIVCGLMLHVALSALNTHYCAPRKTVPYENELKIFREEGISNYSTMLMRDDLGVLLLGAREAIYALDIDDISVRKSAVYWRVTEEKQRECTYKGKHAEVECRNYIRTLHRVNDTAMYVCGTNAFSPTCDYMTFVSGQLRLQGKQEEGKGKCPFDPFQRYSSLMVGNDLYSATSINFLGSEPVVLRSSNLALRTEFKSSWLSEPNFVYMDFVGESFDSSDGDDDKVYLFFSENAMEYDFYSKVTVSRVARVCKGDMGGQRTLQRKWTSFLKARLDCSLPEPSLPPIVQDVFLLKHEDWRKSVFYAVFTPQSRKSLWRNNKGLLYAGSEFGSVQMPVSNCSRYDTCVDCILARDPYCAWDFSTERCSSVHSLPPSSISAMQSLKEGDVSRCPQPDPVAAVDFTLVPQNNIQLSCQLHSNLAQVVWRFSDQTLHSNHKYYIYGGGLLILSASESDAGLYTCDSVEQINGRTYNRTVAVYRLKLYSDPGVGESTTPGTEVTNSWDSSHTLNTTALVPNQGEDPSSPETHSDTGRVTRLEVAVALLSLLCLCLMGVIFCIWSGGRWACFRFTPVLQSPSESEGKRKTSCEYMHIQNRTSEVKFLGPESGSTCAANNNHTTVDFKGNGEHHFTPMANISSLDGLGYINDESEI
nr:PREDICTED: semaphorin-4E-like [Paralichthys olivaceus]